MPLTFAPKALLVGSRLATSISAISPLKWLVLHSAGEKKDAPKKEKKEKPAAAPAAAPAPDDQPE